MSLVHRKFTTTKTADKEDTVFFFRSNHSLVAREFQGRVFPKDVFTVTFSNTRAQDDLVLVFTFSQSETTASGSESQTWNEPSIFEFGSLNDFFIAFSNNSIIFTSQPLGSSITITGIFEEFRFIGFHSESLTTWVLIESTHHTDTFLRNDLFLLKVNPGGIIELSEAGQVVLQDVINVTCTEKQLGNTSIRSDLLFSILFITEYCMLLDPSY